MGVVLRQGRRVVLREASSLAGLEHGTPPNGDGAG
jgi:hypothetical protein